MSHKDDFFKTLEALGRTNGVIKEYRRLLDRVPETPSREDVVGVLHGAPSIATAHKYLRLFRAYMRWIGRGGDLDGLTMVEQETDVRGLSVGQLRALLEAADPHMRDFVTLAVLTGLRRMALSGMEWEDIDWEERLLRYIRKGGRIRFLPLPPEAMTVLYRMKDEDRMGWGEHIGRNPHSKPFPYSYSTYGAKFQAVVKAANVDASIHTLRHTCAMRLLDAGADVRQIQQVLGHEDIRTTMRYLNHNDDRLREAMSKAAVKEEM